MLKKFLHRTSLVNQTVLLLPFCKWHLENQMKYYKLLWILSCLQQICSKSHLGLILIPEGHTHYLFRKEELWPIAAAICNNGLAVTKCLAELKKYNRMFVPCLLPNHRKGVSIWYVVSGLVPTIHTLALERSFHSLDLIHLVKLLNSNV